MDPTSFLVSSEDTLVYIILQYYLYDFHSKLCILLALQSHSECIRANCWRTVVEAELDGEKCVCLLQ